MKFAITGHTRGLGAAIVRHISHEHNVLGFSRENGFDITSVSDRQRIITDSEDCDVFINNAHNGYSQVELLYELWDCWKDKSKLIVNIGSNTTDGIKTFPHKYVTEKIALEKANEQLANLNKPCKVSLYRFGWIGTERVIDNYNPAAYITPADAAAFIVNTTMLSSSYRLVTTTLLP